MSELAFCDVCGNRVYLPAKNPERHQSCDKMRSRIEAETIAKVVAWLRDGGPGTAGDIDAQMVRDEAASALVDGSWKNQT